MQAEAVQATLRPRDGMEAVDLGLRMSRVWWRPIFGAWLVFVVPPACIAIVALRHHPLWAVALLWWLRPVFDRVPLHVLGRTLFGEPAGIASVARALPSLARSGLWRSLLLERLSPYRTFTLPVLQLEGLRGPAAGERARLLVARDTAAALALVATGALANGILMAGLLAGLQLLVPPEVTWDVLEAFAPLLGDADDDPGMVLLPALYFAGTTLVEPLLVAGGFALYVNRRIYLEGWDLELAFRGLAVRSRAEETGSARARVGRVARVAALVLLALGTPRAALAEPCEPDRETSAKVCIASVLASEDFGRTEEVERWTLRSAETDVDLEGFSWLGSTVASLFEIGFWVGIALTILALIVALARYSERFAPRAPERPVVAPVSVAGLELDPASLPPDLLGAARTAWQAGRRAEALSLLYRGAILAFHERRALAIPPSATERECLRAVLANEPPEPAAVFSDLTGAWMAARYADRPPSDVRFAALCADLAPLLAGSGPQAEPT